MPATELCWGCVNSCLGGTQHLGNKLLLIVNNTAAAADSNNILYYHFPFLKEISFFCSFIGK